MQQKWVEKLGRGNRYICWSVVSTRVAMSHELGGEGGSVGIRQFGRVMRTGFRALSQVFSSFGWVGVPRRSTSHETSWQLSRRQFNCSKHEHSRKLAPIQHERQNTKAESGHAGLFERLLFGDVLRAQNHPALRCH